MSADANLLDDGIGVPFYKSARQMS